MSELQELKDQVVALTNKFDQIQRCGLSGGQLRAQSISIMCSSRTRCNAGCLFCISRITPETQTDNLEVKLLDLKRLEIGLDFAARGGATTAILTGKADPLQESPIYLCNLIRKCREKMPIVDLHTNGIGLIKQHKINDLIDAGLTMITVSIAEFLHDTNIRLMHHPFKPDDLLRKIPNDKLLVRCSLVLNKGGVNNFRSVQAYVLDAKKHGAHQVVVRELWLPDVSAPPNAEIKNWNKENFVPIANIAKEFENFVHIKNDSGVKFVRFLPWGTPVYDVQGVNVTFARCEESFNGGTLKSIVHKVDGHGYMDWDHNGSILY